MGDIIVPQKKKPETSEELEKRLEQERIERLQKLKKAKEKNTETQNVIPSVEGKKE